MRLGDLTIDQITEICNQNKCGQDCPLERCFCDILDYGQIDVNEEVDIDVKIS